MTLKLLKIYAQHQDAISGDHKFGNFPGGMPPDPPRGRAPLALGFTFTITIPIWNPPIQKSWLRRWGFLAKNVDSNQMHFVSEGRELLDLLEDSTQECSGFPMNSKTMLFNTKKKQEYQKLFTDKKTSLVHAIFVTSYARIKLCEALLVVGSKAHYFDADSLIYSHPIGQPIIPVGEYLGDWESEMKNERGGYSIVKFISGGPKNYDYHAVHPTKEDIFIVKIRGFTLHAKASKMLDFNCMLHLIMSTIRAFFC